MALSFKLESTALPANTRVVGFSGREKLSRPYEIDVYASVEGPLEIEPRAVVGQPATLLIDDTPGAGPPVMYGGMLGRFSLMRATADSTLYKATIVPRLWTLAYTKHSRVWTKMSIDAILRVVLAQEGVPNVQFRLTSAYAPEEHVCQYRESSLDFIHRWMEREGMYYFFEQVGGAEIMVVVDSLVNHRPSAHGPVRYHPAEGDMSAGRHFNDFAMGASSLPAMVKVSDYDYAKPGAPVMGMAPAGIGGVGVFSEPPGNARVFSPGDAARIAKVRAEAFGAEGAEGHATGSALGLSPGFTFLLENHPRASFEKAYLVTRQRIIGRDGTLAKGWGRLPDLEGDDQVLSVDIDCIPAEVQYRAPLETRWPRVDGYEIGVVDGTAGSEYAQLDQDGRYLVRFKFDENPNPPGQGSTYVRMMQPHAGTVEGWHFPLRKDTEVLFLFLGGDPDRPVIAGAVPNAMTPSLVTASNNTKNVLQTGARNRFELEDMEGKEWVKLSTPGDETHLFMGKPGEGGDHSFVLETQKDGLVHTGTNFDLRVDQKWDVKVQDTLTEDVQSDVTEKYHANLDQTVDSDKTVDVSGSYTETVGGGSTQTISGGSTQMISGGEVRTVSGGVTETISGGETRDVSSSFTETISASWTQTVNGSVTQTTNASSTHTINGSLTQTITGGATIVTPAAYNLTATGGVTINCEAGMKVLAPGGVHFDAPGGFTVVAPGGIRTVDESLQNVGAVKSNNFGIYVTGYAFKLEVSEISLTRGVKKMDIAGLFASFTGFEWSNLVAKKGATGFKIATRGIDVEANGIQGEN